MRNEETKKQLLVFGGCFNPPLNSHFSLAEQILNEYEEIEKILFVPVNSKYQKPGLVSNEHRYNMLKLVCDKNERFEVSKIEIDKGRQLFTVETLRELKEIYSEYEIAFTTGSDNLAELDTWETADELVKEFRIYVIERGDADIDAIIESNEFLKNNKESFIKVKKNIKTNLSSTYVRGKIKEGKSIKYLAPEEVIEYIKQNNLYK